MDVDLEAPDHITLSRRTQHFDVALNLAPVNEPIHPIIDSTGLSVVGEGEWELEEVDHGTATVRTGQFSANEFRGSNVGREQVRISEIRTE
jgi:hypothetical protein